MNTIQKLYTVGQSVWYDNIQRGLLDNGELGRMIERGEVRGVTSNPTIFMNAITKSDDYDASLSTEERDGVTYLKATLIPKPDAPVVYSELVFLITREDWVPVRSEYYDDGELIRAWAFDRIETIDGRRIPMRMTILPVDKPDESTVVEYLELELNVPVDDQLFTRQGLRRAARG